MNPDHAPLILIVDDDYLNRELLEGILTLEGFRVLAANSGHKAVEMAQMTQPDALVLDMRMPGMSGFEVCEVLKSDSATRQIRILMISASDQSDEVMQAQQAGADGFLSRSRLMQDLVANLRALIAEP